MQVGSLVQFDDSWSEGVHIGVVVGFWVHDISDEYHWLVHWLIGKYTGDTDAIIESDLEVLCE